MYKLLLKKSFFDGWDNILFLFILNIVFVACILGVGFTAHFVLVPILLLVFSFHLLGVNGAMFNVTRCKDTWYQGYANAIKKVGHFLVYYLAMVISLAIICYIVPFYLSMGDLVWFTVGFFMFFLGLILFIALMYYFPLCLALEKDGPFKTLKKCFMIFFDNFWFTIYVFLKNICDLFISVFTMFLMPGITGTCVTVNTAIYLMMLRYDWMEENKVGKHNISADMYLAPVFELYSQRNLGTLLFPWKK